MNASAKSVDMKSEAKATVNGATLQYLLGGLPAPAPVIVFENGWGASYEKWTWVERELAPHARLLFYNRAGIGGSSITQPQTANLLSLQLRVLLASLEITEPVILVGQSYGGLMCALHATQQTQMVRALVELDPTPDRNDPLMDPQLQLMKPVARIAMLCSWLGIPPPLFSQLGKTLPQPEGSHMVKKSFGSAASLRAALAELDLIGDIRAAIAEGNIKQPHLVISADRGNSEGNGLIGKLLAPPEKVRAVIDRMQTLHRAKVEGHPAGEWQTLPYDHGSLIFEQAGAKASARKILEFIGQLPGQKQ